MRTVSYLPTKVFIAYASDTTKEQESAHRIIERYQRSIKALVRVDLQLATWNDVKVDIQRAPGEAFQDFINRRLIENCRIFVLIAGARYGSRSKGFQRTNLEREVDEALRLRLEFPDFVFLPFFRKLLPDEDQGPQREGVEKIKKKLMDKGVAYYEYQDECAFVEIFTHELYKRIAEMRVFTPKHIALKEFFNIGQPSKDAGYEIVISYPPMDKKYMGESHGEKFWLKRLIPNLVFEDYKALQKIEKCLRMVGIRKFKICSTANLPDHWQHLNRIWICLPRNLTAQTQLQKHYSGVSKFAIEPENGNKRTLVWKQEGKQVRIQSPLELYLQLQRENVSPQSEWNTTLRDIVAKDYAILARFSAKPTATKPHDGVLKDFFLGGIRGLGTWGAGWYLDRKFEVFSKHKPHEDFQVLLEVIYRNGRIFDVIDVSCHPQEYFDKENSREQVANIIKMHEEDRILAE